MGVIHLIGVRQIDDLFRIELLAPLRDEYVIGDDIVHIRGAERTGITQEIDLDRRAAVGEGAQARALGEAV